MTSRYWVAPGWSVFHSLAAAGVELFFFFFFQLNLKFEIEVLCKNLSLDINDLKPGNLLKDKEKLKMLEEQLSAPKKESKPPEEMLPVSTTGCASCAFFISQSYPQCRFSRLG